MQPAPPVWVHVVDDDASVREALSWLLRSRGIASVTHADGEAFWREVQAMGQQPKDQWQPSCVLLDVRMPGMSGLAVFERLLSLQLTRFSVAMPIWPLRWKPFGAARLIFAKSPSLTTPWWTAWKRPSRARVRRWRSCRRVWTATAAWRS